MHADSRGSSNECSPAATPSENEKGVNATRDILSYIVLFSASQPHVALQLDIAFRSLYTKILALNIRFVML